MERKNRGVDWSGRESRAAAPTLRDVHGRIRMGSLKKPIRPSLLTQEDEVRTKGSVVASDAFFPFPDGVEVCAAAGATAIIQPGGSKRDQEVIQVADELGLAMVFTEMRHFLH